jgi:hypothetical protein
MYLKEWLDYHTFIGVDKFYLYDNAESMCIDHMDPMTSLPTKNKYGYSYQLGIDQSRRVQEDLAKEYNIEIVQWSPINENGQIVYGQVESMTHLSSIKDSGLVAFIDVDEFIVKQEGFRPSRMLQVKYESRNSYTKIMDLERGFKINTELWSPKCIIDMSEYIEPSSIHFPELDLPISKSFFNHYNHNPVGHNWLSENYLDQAPSWTPVEYENVFVKMPTLRELSGFSE